MGINLREPASLQEAQQYIGRSFWKFFRETGKWYEGTIEDIDTELEAEGGLEQGLFFLARYKADNECEHLTWEQLASLLKKSEKKKWEKGSSGSSRKLAHIRAGEVTGSDTNSGTPKAADVAAVADRSSKRARRSGAPHQAEAAGGHGAAAGPSAGHGTPGSGLKPPKASPAARKRPRAEQQQEQEQDGGSGRQRQHGSKRAQQRQAADVIPDSEDEGPDAEPDDDAEASSEEYDGHEAGGRPQKKARKQQQQKPLPPQQQRRRPQQRRDEQGDEDMGEAAEEEHDEEELQRQFDAADQQHQQEHDAAADAARAYDPNLDVTVRKQGLAGHVKHVQVQNFMCHENFVMEFGTHVNIISGSNGSGKSAVLQAMQAALGAKAKDTGRGDNFRELVRTGCHEGKVKVTLWNTGEDACMHDRYGDWVSIERTVRASGGGNTYRLFNSLGRKVAEGFKAVQALLDHLNVDASNPLVVLTQDTARNFLCGSIADKKKYDLFMKATMLQSIYDHLMKASAYTDQMKEAFKEVLNDHRKRQQSVVELRERLQKLEASVGMADKRTTYEAAAAYAMLQDRQQMLQQQKEQLEVKAPQHRAAYETKIAACSQRLDQLRAQEAELLAAQEAHNEANTKFAADMTALADAMRKARNEQKAKQRAAAKLRDQVEGLRSEIKQIMEAKRETHDDRQQEFQQRMQQHEAAMAAARQQHHALEAQAAQAQQRLDGVREAIRAKTAEVAELQGRRAGVTSQLTNLQEHLKQLQAAKGQKLVLFGRHAQLRQLVDRNRARFERLPIGPLGAHLTLTDEKWSVAAEEGLGRTLETWLVHSARDQELLLKLAREANLANPTVLVGSFDRPAYTISANRRLRAEWKSLRQFVTLEHPQYAHIIDNKLMDMVRYEVLVVDEEEDRCFSAAKRGAGDVEVPRAITVSGKHFTRHRRGTVVAGNPTVRRPRLAASFEQSRLHTEDVIRKCEADAAALQQQLVAAHAELQELNGQAHSLDMAHRKALGDKARAGRQLQQLQLQMPVLPADEASDEDFVADQLRQLQEQLNAAQLQADKAESELQEATLRLDQAKQLHDDRQAEIQDTLTQVGNTLEALNRVTEQVAKYNEVQETLGRKMQDLEAKIEQVKQNVATVQGEVDHYAAEASKICPEEAGWAALDAARAELLAEAADKLRPQLERRIRSGQANLHINSPEELEQHVNNMLEPLRNELHSAKAVQMFARKAAALDRLISEAEQEAGGNKEELQHSLRKAELEYKRLDKPVKNMQSVVQLTSQAVDARWQKYDEQFESVQRRVSNKFSLYMHRRGHQGRVVVDQNESELRLLVKINNQGQSAEEKKKAKAVKDLKQLSGGERSFTTVAFILALGEWTESPFRALDEFDVFMDAINRRIATQTLLEFAREKAELQFVLLTPQDLQAVEDAKKKLAEAKNGKPLPEGFVKVVQMRPARPGQANRQQH